MYNFNIQRRLFLVRLIGKRNSSCQCDKSCKQSLSYILLFCSNPNLFFSVACLFSLLCETKALPEVQFPDSTKRNSR